jgi:hypothetical protein
MPIPNELMDQKKRVQMTLFDKAVYTLAAVAVILIVGLVVAYRVANTVPSRPKGVAHNAEFLWAPAVGFPGGLPRRGWWLTCWENAGHDYCMLNDIDGNTEYEGEFIPYANRNAMPTDQLEIDAGKTTEHKLWIGSALVPLIYLKNGKVLIPASKYEEGVRLLK